MKTLWLASIVLLFVGLANSAAAQITEKELDLLVRKGEIQCLYYGSVHLKPTIGDKIHDQVGLAFFLDRRQDYHPISCERYLASTFRNGWETFFDLLRQIEKVDKNGLIGLLDQKTAFSESQKNRARAELNKLKVQADPILSQFVKLVMPVYENRPLNENATTLQIKDLNNLDDSVIKDLSSVRFSAMHDFSVYHFALALQIRTRETFSPQGINIVSQFSQKVIKHAQTYDVREWGDFDLTETLILAGQIPEQTNKPLFRHLQAALAQDNMMAFSKLTPTGVMENGQTSLCPEILGALVRHADTPSYRSHLTSWYIAQRCDETKFSIKPPSIQYRGLFQRPQLTVNRQDVGDLRNSEDQYNDLVLDLVRAGANSRSFVELALARARSCAPEKDMAVLGQLLIPTSYTTAVLEGNCANLIEPAAQRMAQYRAKSVLESKIPRASALSIAKLILSLRQNQLPLNADEEKKQISFYGKPLERALRMQGRVHGPYAQEMVGEAEDKDDENTVRLNWAGGIQIDLKRSQLKPYARKMIEGLRQAQTDEEINHQILEAVIAQQMQARGIQRSKQFARSLEQFGPRSQKDLSENLSSAKEFLDATMATHPDSAYNFTATSIFDILNEGRLQCNSGTDFLLTHLMKTGGLETTQQAAVAIFKPQHILPGVMTKQSSNLMGIESTVSGKGRISIELLRGRLPPNHQAVLATHYLLMKVLEDALLDREKTKSAFLDRAEKVLGIKQGTILPDSAPQKNEGDSLNRSIFAFGSAQIPQGDVPRLRMDQLNSGQTAADLLRPTRPAVGSSRPNEGSNAPAGAQLGGKNVSKVGTTNVLTSSSSGDEFSEYAQLTHIPEVLIAAMIRRSGTRQSEQIQQIWAQIWRDLPKGITETITGKSVPKTGEIILELDRVQSSRRDSFLMNEFLVIKERFNDTNMFLGELGDRQGLTYFCPRNEESCRNVIKDQEISRVIIHPQAAVHDGNSSNANVERHAILRLSKSNVSAILVRNGDQENLYRQLMILIPAPIPEESLLIKVNLNPHTRGYSILVHNLDADVKSRM